MANIKKIRVNISALIDLDVIDQLYQACIDSKKHLEENLRNEFGGGLRDDEKEIILDAASDEFFLAELTTELAGEMIIIALFKTIEIAIKRMAIGSDLFTPDEIKSFYQFSKLEKAMKSKVYDICTLTHYNEYYELRCINNAVKHSGMVTVELAKFPNWTGKKGNKLEELNKHYDRLKEPNLRFVEELKMKIIDKVQ